MTFVHSLRFLLTVVMVLWFADILWACDSCSITRIGRAQGQNVLSSRESGWFAQ